ncbi:lysophospholipase [Amycolatopsis acidicola]|uniref:Lysophospholipase n=1 Tax=Amycolatopsis acidicola TaxID=2596893 RepID=A0A5N0V4N2_9PSEU|nr:lysophospholipase [Amycolatopsis acidicola]KAA9160111.1 lysophospholipase [Amycolatopsis acidicola]
MSEYLEFEGPEGLRTRGTVVVVPGRGETRRTYTRLGKRLAADTYRVRVVDAPRIDADVAGSLARLGNQLTAAVAGATDRPLTLIGADVGATALAALIAGQETTADWSPDAVVLAGPPGRARGVPESWDDELDVRTLCPVHRVVLTEDGAVERGSLAEPVPGELLEAAYGGSAVPQLFVVGDADPLADHEALARAVKASPSARLSVVRGARHDVLNDRQHRSVAAEIVGFLETLGNELVPVISVESSSW